MTTTLTGNTTTVISGLVPDRAAADAAFEHTRAVMAARTGRAEREAAAHAEQCVADAFRASHPAAAARLDKEMAAAETTPERTPEQARFAQHRAQLEIAQELECEAG